MKLQKYLILGFCLFMLSFTGCLSNQGRTTRRLDQTVSPQGQNIIQIPPQNQMGGNLGYASPSPTPAVPQPMTYSTPLPATNDRSRADAIKSRLSGMKELSQVNVVVLGNTCLVGYAPSNASKDANATKQIVSDAVKQIDNSITTVACSESADITAKINQLSTNIANDKSANEIGSRFNDIVQKIVPTVR